jgi:nitroreductase
MSVEQALQQRRSRREGAAEALSLQEVAQVLWATQVVTDPSGRRTAPSAGARAPLKLHLVVDQVMGLRPGVYRYAVQNVYLQCTARGLATVFVGAFGEPLLRQTLGLMPFGRRR